MRLLRFPGVEFLGEPEVRRGLGGLWDPIIGLVEGGALTPPEPLGLWSAEETPDSGVPLDSGEESERALARASS